MNLLNVIHFFNIKRELLSDIKFKNVPSELQTFLANPENENRRKLKYYKVISRIELNKNKSFNLLNKNKEISYLSTKAFTLDTRWCIKAILIHKY